MTVRTQEERAIEQRYRELEPNFRHWEKIKDVIDQFIDIMLNYRLSGHPGGSRSKVHALVALLLSGAMRWDIRHPEKRFGDRFILSAGHTIPVIYATLACFNEALRAKHDRTGRKEYLVPNAEEFQLTWEDLTKLRRRGGLPGHAEMEGKTLFLKANTGPSGHGSPPSAGEAMALKRAGAEGVKVFTVEGEGGLTPGAAHETKNSAWGLGLDNLFYMVDWNDHGIDEFAAHEVVHGTPRDWFEPYGWRVFGTDQGSEWEPVTRALLETHLSPNPEKTPTATYFKTIKGRGYIVTGYKSHGKAHDTNSPLFWQLRKEFGDKYGVSWVGLDQPAPSGKELIAQCYANLKVVVDTMRADEELVDYLADRLVEIGESVPTEIASLRLDLAKGNPLEDKRAWDYTSYPKELFVAPGSKVPNRSALAKWGAFVNAFGRKYYDRPLFLALSADLAESTNIHGFMLDWDGTKGYGWYNRHSNPGGVLLPQEITEFTNAGIACGIATINLSHRPLEEYQGFFAACSTYGSFSYLKYGPMRLFNQLAQDSQIKVGKVLWIAGHSGPETAEDSRTHFGIFETGVTQLFPEGSQIVNLVPWEANEVPVMLGAAFQTDAPIVVLHLTRPAVEIPDREKLGMASHLDAARGAYVLREYRAGQPKLGTIIVNGTYSTYNVVRILPRLDELKLNVRLVAAVSWELFKMQPREYREAILPEHEWMTSTYITNASRRLMRDWTINRAIADEYAMTADFDNRWRTGGTPDEVIEEAHLSQEWLLTGIQRFVSERPSRIKHALELLQQANVTR